MMKLYISGPMTIVGPPTWNFPAFNEAARLLKAHGYDVENPAEKGIVEGYTWEDYMRYDIRALLDCDGVATLSDWENSDGAQFEVYVADKLKMPVKPVSVWLSADRPEFVVR